MVDDITSDRKASYQQLFNNGYQELPREFTPTPSKERQEQVQKVNGAILNKFAKDTTTVAPTPLISSQISSDLSLAVDLNDPALNSDSFSETHVSIENLQPGKDNEIATEQEVNDMWNDPNSKTAFVIDNLMCLADQFVDQAHNHVLQANSSEGQLAYFKLIKLSLKCLLLILNKHERALSAQQLLVVYYKLARTYFLETANLELAEKYIYKCITVSSRNDLVKQRFLAEYLQSQILRKSNPNLVLNHFDDQISQFSQYPQLCNLFKILKVENLLLTDDSLALVMLQNLCKTSENSCQIYCLLLQGNLHLYRGNPKQCLVLMDELDKIVSLGQFKLKLPNQIVAMTLLMRLHTYIKLNDYRKAKSYMKQISKYIMEEQRGGWKSWNEGGTVSLDVKLDLNQDSVTIPFQISWLNSDEFVILFYFFTGICLLFDANKAKSKTMFEKCIQIIEKQLVQLSGEQGSGRKFPIYQLNKKIIKLKFIKYNINYYQVWLNFLNNDLTNISYLNEYMLMYNNQKFTNEEFGYFELLMPRIFYLIAVYYHYHGDIQAAKYYYAKVRNLTSEKTQIDKRNCELQYELGLGCANFSPKQEFNELYVFSSLHLLIINEFEWSEVSKSGLTDKMNSLYELNSELLSKLASALDPKNFSNGFEINFPASDELLRLTYSILLNDTEKKGEEAKLIENLVESLQNHKYSFSYPFIYKLLIYIAYTKSSDLNIKMKFQEKCLKVLSQPCVSDNDRIINALMLKSLVTQFKLNGEIDKANMAELQIQFYCNSLSDKFQFVLNNVDREYKMITN